MNTESPMNIAPPRGFSIEEYQARLAKAQKLMAQQEMAAMLLCTEPELRYYAGFHTPFWQSPTRPWFLILPQSGMPVAVIPQIGLAAMQTSWVEDIRCWPAPRPEDDGVSLLHETLWELAGQKGKIGVPMGHETHIRMPAKDFDRLRQTLGWERFLDATAIIRNQRMIKSPAEIAKIQHICTLTSHVFDDLPNFVTPGDKEHEIFTKMRLALLQAGADNVPYLVGASGQVNGVAGFRDIIKLPSDHILSKNDLLMLDTGAQFDGYYCDFDRNFACEIVDDTTKIAYDMVFEATEAGLEAAKIGTRTCDLFAAMNAVFIKYGKGEGDVGRFGHGLGMQLTEWPSHSRYDETILEENMVITLEPGMLYGNNLIMLHEENIVITQDGARLLTRRAPAQIPIIQ